MATKNEVAKKKQAAPMGINAYMNNENVKKSIANAVGAENMPRFISSVVSAVQTNKNLMECTNSSILSAALLGESLQLPPSPQLGFFYMVPYNSENGKEAQFQLGAKGYVQLAIRSGQYKKIVASEVKEGELVSYNPITEDVVLEPIMDEKVRNKKPTIGYYGLLELNNGYRKEMYWSKEKMDAHAKRYSIAYKKGWSTPWKTDFDAMGCKTIIRQMISKWGIMSVEMQKAYTADMGVIDEDGNVKYVDNDQPIEEKVADDIAENANKTEFQPEDVVVESKIVNNDEAPFK